MPRPHLLVAALLAVLALLSMHSIVALPAAASSAAASGLGHAHHEHTHDGPGAPHAHPEPGDHAHLSTDSGSDTGGHPCTTCPGCGHDTASACALTPAKIGGNDPLLSTSDLAPAPYQLASWPTYATNPRQATPTPPSLIALSISRT